MKIHDFITDELLSFIKAPHVFFVATAPLSANGHVNLSPKGLDTFRVLSPKQVAYLDLTGSGNETAAHLRENGRITFMFCGFQEKPLILRLYGTGRTVMPGSGEWPALMAAFPQHPGVRQIILADINRVQTSCGYGVPIFEIVGERDTLAQWSQKKGEEGLIAYRKQKNLRSIDGLPTGLEA